MLGPLTSLRVRGSLCPCLLHAEETVARRSDVALAQMMREPVRWHQVGRPSPTDDDDDEEAPPPAAGGFWSGILSKSAAVSSSLVGRRKVHVVDATWCLRDSGFLSGLNIDGAGSGRTVILELSARTDDDDDDSDDGDASSRLRLPLKRIGAVKTSPQASSSSWTNVEHDDATTTTTTATPAYSVAMISLYGHGQEELARLEIHTPSALRVSAAEIAQHLTLLVEWDRDRRRHDGEEEDEEEAAHNNQGMLRAKAAKAAHFAKTELEMKQRKRDVEKKKAKYLKDAGGLKYTALAMANRAT